MNTFLIADDTNYITLSTAPEENSSGAIPHFSDEAELAALSSDWPIARLVVIWNSIPGASPVKKFTDKKTAVTRIWKALQGLSPELPEEAASELDDSPTVPAGAAREPGVAQPPSPSKNKRGRAKRVPSGQAMPVSAAPTTEAPRNSKTTQVVALLKRSQGATLNELMAATNWQAHSVRGFLSGTLAKKMGLAVVSAKSDGGERTYSISA